MEIGADPATSVHDSVQLNGDRFDLSLGDLNFASDRVVLGATTEVNFVLARIERAVKGTMHRVDEVFNEGSRAA